MLTSQLLKIRDKLSLKDVSITNADEKELIEELNIVKSMISGRNNDFISSSDNIQNLVIQTSLYDHRQQNRSFGDC